MTRQLHFIAGPSWSGDSAALLRGSRRVRWRVELLDSRGRVVRDISADVAAVSVEFNLHATIRSGGSLEYRGATPVDWMTHRVRVHYQLDHHGASLEWPVGTFVPEVPTSVLTGGGRPGATLDLFDLMYRLDRQASTAGEWVARRGANVVETVRHLLDRGQIGHSIEDGEATFANDMAWPAGTSYLRMVNDMFEAANYFGAWADPMGLIRSAPYRAPAYRGTAYTFEDQGGGLPYADGLKHTLDLYEVPNQVVLVAESSDPEAEPMTATATDTTSPYSFARRQIRITRVEENVKASSLAALQGRAARRLEELQRPASTLEFRHLPAPLAPNDVVRITRQAPALDMVAVVEKTAYGTGSALATTTVREVQV